MRLRHIPNPAGLIKDTSCRPHQGAGGPLLFKHHCTICWRQFVDLPAEAEGCTWMLKIHARSAVSSGVDGEVAQLLPLDGHLTFHSRDSLSPCSHLPLCFPSLPSPPPSRDTVFHHARRVNLNPFNQHYPSYLGVWEPDPSMTSLCPSQDKKECSSFFLHLWLQQQIKHGCPASLYTTI